MFASQHHSIAPYSEETRTLPQAQIAIRSAAAPSPSDERAMDPLEAIINEVVNQFADPLAFFRELVQNAIDSGTQEIVISFSYENGTAVMRVDDFGEGMSLDIIQNKLTRLFASGKEDDFTKIGRFGIGFASVFAIKPDFVVVDTARSGEQWRALFSADRTWEVMELDEPREGTCVTVVKKMYESEFRDLEKRALDVIKYWCRFARVPILIEGVDIREPFAVEAPVCVTTHEEETTIVAGFVDQREAKIGYYNRGLTLLETVDSRWRHMTFRIDSRYLEHTLTRDRIRETEHWDRVVEMLDHVHDELLPKQFLTEIQEASHDAPSARWEELMMLLPAIKRNYPNLEKPLADQKIFPTSTGTWVSANTLRLNLKDRKAYLHSDSHVAKDLDAILIIGNPEVHAVATKVFGFQLVRPEEAWIRAIEFGELPRTDRLMRELMELHPKIAEIKFISLAYQGSLVGSEAAIWNPKNERDIHASEWKKSREKRFFQFEFLALNCANTAVYNALEIAQSEPEFAAYVLSKLLLARTGIPTETDDIWMKKVTTRRVARIGQ